MDSHQDKANLSFDIFETHCPSRKAFDQIFSRWGILVLARLSTESIRFGSLRRAVGGISEKMLSQTLKTLEEVGLVQRREWEEKPPRVEYSLTPSGLLISQSVATVIKNLYGELEKNQILHRRRSVDER